MQLVHVPLVVRRRARLYVPLVGVAGETRRCVYVCVCVCVWVGRRGVRGDCVCWLVAVRIEGAVTPPALTLPPLR